MRLQSPQIPRDARTRGGFPGSSYLCRISGHQSLLIQRAGWAAAGQSPLLLGGRRMFTSAGFPGRIPSQGDAFLAAARARAMQTIRVGRGLPSTQGGCPCARGVSRHNRHPHVPRQTSGRARGTARALRIPCSHGTRITHGDSGRGAAKRYPEHRTPSTSPSRHVTAATRETQHLDALGTRRPRRKQNARRRTAGQPEVPRDARTAASLPSTRRDAALHPGVPEP